MSELRSPVHYFKQILRTPKPECGTPLWRNIPSDPRLNIPVEWLQEDIPELKEGNLPPFLIYYLEVQNRKAWSVLSRRGPVVAMYMLGISLISYAGLIRRVFAFLPPYLEKMIVVSLLGAAVLLMYVHVKKLIISERSIFLSVEPRDLVTSWIYDDEIQVLPFTARECIVLTVGSIYRRGKAALPSRRLSFLLWSAVIGFLAAVCWIVASGYFTILTYQGPPPIALLFIVVFSRVFTVNMLMSMPSLAIQTMLFLHYKPGFSFKTVLNRISAIVSYLLYLSPMILALLLIMIGFMWEIDSVSMNNVVVIRWWHPLLALSPLILTIRPIRRYCHRAARAQLRKDLEKFEQVFANYREQALARNEELH